MENRLFVGSHSASYLYKGDLSEHVVRVFTLQVLRQAESKLSHIRIMNFLTMV